MGRNDCATFGKMDGRNGRTSVMLFGLKRLCGDIGDVARGPIQ